MSQSNKSQNTQEEINELKLRNAFKLIKQERYGAARHILRELPEHPKAQKMLAWIEGKSEKRKPQSAVSKWGLFIVLFVVIAIGGAIGAALLFNNYASQYGLEDWVGIGSNGEVGLYSVSTSYCIQSTNLAPNSCSEWPLRVIEDYPEAADACFSPYRQIYYLEASQLNAIRNCLNNHNVPAPY